jgi:hypothetical protein
VEVLELNDLNDKMRYEELLNDESVIIDKEQFAYMKDGTPKITVWYFKEAMS